MTSKRRTAVRPRHIANVVTTGVLYFRDIDVDIKCRFKAWCASHSVSMTRQIEKMMLELVTKAEAK